MAGHNGLVPYASDGTPEEKAHLMHASDFVKVQEPGFRQPAPPLASLAALLHM